MDFPTTKDVMPQRDTGETILKEFFNVYSDWLDDLQELLGYGADFMLVGKLKAKASNFMTIRNNTDEVLVKFFGTAKRMSINKESADAVVEIGSEGVDTSSFIITNNSGDKIIEFKEGSAEVGNLMMYDDVGDQVVQMGTPNTDAWVKCQKFGIKTATPSDELEVNGNINASGYKVGGVVGASGSFTTVDAKTVTVVNGLITSIV